MHRIALPLLFLGAVDALLPTVFLVRDNRGAATAATALAYSGSESYPPPPSHNSSAPLRTPFSEVPPLTKASPSTSSLSFSPSFLPSFILQRSVQTYLSLLVSLRDPYSAAFITDFGDLEGGADFAKFHGLNAIPNHSFVGFYKHLMQRPPTTFTVSTSVVSRGWSENNPYKPPARFIDTDIDITPRNMANRMFKLSERIAREVQVRPPL